MKGEGNNKGKINTRLISGENDTDSWSHLDSREVSSLPSCHTLQQRMHWSTAMCWAGTFAHCCRLTMHNAQMCRYIIQCMAHPPSKVPFLMRRCGPPSKTWFLRPTSDSPKLYLTRFSCFCTVHPSDRQTDRQTDTHTE